MQIIKRAKGKNDGEIIAFNEKSENVKEEAIRRSKKAGYCSSDSEPAGRTKILTTVPFGKQKLNVWPRDEQGRLIE